MSSLNQTTANGLPVLANAASASTFAYVGGAWVAGAENTTLAASDPATVAILAEVAKLNAADSRQAVDAAHSAWNDWAGLLPQDRSLTAKNMPSPVPTTPNTGWPHIFTRRTPAASTAHFNSAWSPSTAPW